MHEGLRKGDVLLLTSGHEAYLAWYVKRLCDGFHEFRMFYRAYTSRPVSSIRKCAAASDIVRKSVWVGNGKECLNFYRKVYGL